MRRVALVACCLAGSAITGCLSGGRVPVEAQEWPLRAASLDQPAPAASDKPAPAAAPAAKPTEPPTATATKNDPCPGRIGTSRTIVAEPGTEPRIGFMQYKTSLPLKDHKVVLTFDDGPVHTYTPRVLDILAANCVKATFFLVGEQATAYPRLVRRIYNDGHSIGTHSEHHTLPSTAGPNRRSRAKSMSALRRLRPQSATLARWRRSSACRDCCIARQSIPISRRSR